MNYQTSIQSGGTPEVLKDKLTPKAIVAALNEHIVGQDDAISTVDEMRTMAQAIAGAEFVIIPRSGHLLPLENPDAFNETVEQFLTRVERSPSPLAEEGGERQRAG